jgi:hypothetical protein
MDARLSYAAKPQDENHEQTKDCYEQPKLQKRFKTPSFVNKRCPPIDIKFLCELYNERRNSSAREIKIKQQLEVLQQQGFPTGLASLLLSHTIDHPVRLWLVDNCGTMIARDGHRVVQSTKSVEIIDCSRWEEVTTCVIWHAEMSAWCQNPTAIRLLKDPGHHIGPQQCGICASNHLSSSEEVLRLKALLRKTRPLGVSSPITQHLQELIPAIKDIIPVLKQRQSRIVLHICTDSIPSDVNGVEQTQIKGDFESLLQSAVDWPIRVVLRLSTDEERVVNFYETMARKTNFANILQVLDDFVSECKKVKQWNPWLNYGYPLHLCREAGIFRNTFEQLGRRPLERIETMEVVCILFGKTDMVDFKTYRPDSDYKTLRKQIKDLNLKTGKYWSPISKGFVTWINLKQLDKVNKVGSCTIS